MAGPQVPSRGGTRGNGTPVPRPRGRAAPTRGPVPTLPARQTHPYHRLALDLAARPRLVAIDIEGTGYKPVDGRSVIELAAVEIAGGALTGASWVSRFNPDAPMNPVAIGIHGIRPAQLEGEPRFAERAGDLLAFLDGAPMVFHGAGDDLRAINLELAAAGLPPLAAPAACTVKLAQSLWPKQPARLSVVLERLGIDAGARKRRRGHAALSDATLAAKAWLAMVAMLRQPQP